VDEMKWVLLAILVFTVLAFIILITRVKINFDYFHDNDDDHLLVTVKAWGGLLKYKMDVPVIKVDDNSPAIVAKKKTKTGPQETLKKEETTQIDNKDILNSIHDFREILTHIVGLHKIIREFLKKVTICNITWHTMVGVGDAAATAVITGALWAAKGGMIGMLSQYMKLTERPIVTISPSFQQPISSTSFTCILQIRVGHAILAGIKLVKYWKGGWPHFKLKPRSAISSENSNSVKK